MNGTLDQQYRDALESGDELAAKRLKDQVPGVHIGPHNVARAERGVVLERTATAQAVEDGNQELTAKRSKRWRGCCGAPRYGCPGRQAARRQGEGALRQLANQIERYLPTSGNLCCPGHARAHKNSVNARIGLNRECERVDRIDHGVSISIYFARDSPEMSLGSSVSLSTTGM